MTWRLTGPVALRRESGACSHPSEISERLLPRRLEYPFQRTPVQAPVGRIHGTLRAHGRPPTCLSSSPSRGFGNQAKSTDSSETAIQVGRPWRSADVARTAIRVLSSRATGRQRNAEPPPLRTSDRPSNRDHLQRRARKLRCPRTKSSTLGQRQRERSRLAADICKLSPPPCGLSSRFLAVNEARRQALLPHSSKIWCFPRHSSTSRALPRCGQRPAQVSHPRPSRPSRPSRGTATRPKLRWRAIAHRWIS
jgi:hypothetical protein